MVCRYPRPLHCLTLSFWHFPPPVSVRGYRRLDEGSVVKVKLNLELQYRDNYISVLKSVSLAFFLLAAINSFFKIKSNQILICT